MNVFTGRCRRVESPVMSNAVLVKIGPRTIFVLSKSVLGPFLSCQIWSPQIDFVIEIGPTQTIFVLCKTIFSPTNLVLGSFFDKTKMVLGLKMF